MDAGNIAPFCFASALSFILLIREVKCRKRAKTWQKSEGKYLGEQYFKKYEDYYSVIGFEFAGEKKEQICEFSLYTPQLGEYVPILIDPQSGRIFLNTWRGRWTLSIILLICAIALFSLSYVSKPMA